MLQILSSDLCAHSRPTVAERRLSYEIPMLQLFQPLGVKRGRARLISILSVDIVRV